MSIEACYLSFCDFFARHLYSLSYVLLLNISPEPLGSETPYVQAIAPLQLKSYTAIGDSFAAGLRAIPGAHLPWCDDRDSKKDNCTSGACLKNLGSYPYLASTSNDWDLERFNFLACAGSNTISCKDNQVNSPDFGTPDVVSIHIGGNNNDSFGPVMTNCIYKRGWGCDEALKNAESTIASIEVHFDDLFNAIRTKPYRDDTQARHVFAMGYPKFYNATTVGSCQSWQINWPSPGKDGMRQRLNSLIDGINAQIKNATIRAGGVYFHYVDADAYFDGHRLCDQTDDVWFQYLLEWATRQELETTERWTWRKNAPGFQLTNAPEHFDAQDVFQEGPFHPNFNGHKAFLRALTDAIEKVQVSTPRKKLIHEQRGQPLRAKN